MYEITTSHGHKLISKTEIIVLLVLIIWELIWKGIGLWKAGRNNQLGWFLAMLIINTAGLLEIAYILFFQKKSNKND